MGDGCGPGGIQTRAVWCAHVEGWTTLHTNCKPAERPSNQQNCFKVCDWHKELYDWRLGPWNQCQPVISKSLEKPLECVKGEEGIQVREITCIEKDRVSKDEAHFRLPSLPGCPITCQVALHAAPTDRPPSEGSRGKSGPAQRQARLSEEGKQESSVWE